MSKFSIILPVRNGGVYVKECVKSILNQSYPEFNLLVLDNNSSDGTLEWVQKINDNRIKIYPSIKSLTIEENWGRIISIPKNEFITLIGHDDILYPDFLETINLLIAEKPEASLFHTHFNFIDAKSKTKRPCKPMPGEIDSYNLLEGFMSGTIDSMGTGYVMKSKDYDKIGGIPVFYPGLLFADFELWYRLANIKYEVVSSETCFAFRVHQSATSLSSDFKMHIALARFINFINDLRVKNEKINSIVQQSAPIFLMRYCKSLTHRVLRTPKSSRGKNAVNEIVEKMKLMAIQLDVENEFKPEKSIQIKVAKIIDNSSVLSNLFLWFKKIHQKPIFS